MVRTIIRRLLAQKAMELETGNNTILIAGAVLGIQLVETELDQLEKQGYRCYYTGMVLTNKRKPYQKETKRHNFNPSIDRLDSSKGYTPENIVWTVAAVNFMKGSLSETEFLETVAKICSYRLVNHPKLAVSRA